MKLYTKKLAYAVTVMILCLNVGNLCAGQLQINESFKILFLGSSYFNNNNLPGLFEGLVDSSGLEVYIEKWIPSGLYLEDHVNSARTESLINMEKWDYVILQGVGSLTAYPRVYTAHSVYKAIRDLKEKILGNCDSTKVVFCLPWAYEDGMTWLEGWTDTYEDMQFKIYENTLKYSEELDFFVAPVGWAWNKVLNEKNYPLHYLHKSDWSHPSLRGSYLMACVIYSTVYEKSSSNIPYYGGINSNDAKYYQDIASSTVLDSLNLWNITGIETEQRMLSAPENFNLSQNYPNPFNPSTTIQYSIPVVEALSTSTSASTSSAHRLSTGSVEGLQHVTLIVYDVLGREVATLVDRTQSPGKYKIEFDASSLTSGIYYYRLQSGVPSAGSGQGFVETKKLILLK